MIKKCKQCGKVLTSGESNNVCDNCRKLKRDKQKAVNDARKLKKKGHL
ncbi:toprim domain-containing protein [Aminipila terrae]|uniref:Uncharacterized protein n=1 Tax=Aminipila terrae TaxID=2697030 RepID=A0A6P1M8V9_9FIRM|nr:hypothetical protein [Aminipila terrae]QHI71169.1 hypothetical protein Ami3637_01090 [Aminipila terrae]